jgi:hypothetical protein
VQIYSHRTSFQKWKILFKIAGRTDTGKDATSTI